VPGPVKDDAAAPGTLFRSPVVVVHAGMPGAMFDLLRADPSRDVLDGDGRVVATLVSPPEERRGRAVAGRAFGWLAPFLARPRRWEVRDTDGTLALDLRAATRELTVRDANGRQLGVARNVSRTSGAPDLIVEVLADRPGERRGRTVATFRGPGDQESFDYEVRDDDGPIGRLANAHDGKYVLTAGPRMDDEVRALLVGVVCGLVERGWWRLPARPQP